MRLTFSTLLQIKTHAEVLLEMPQYSNESVFTREKNWINLKNTVHGENHELCSLHRLQVLVRKVTVARFEPRPLPYSKVNIRHFNH
jgi:hypothetical protein